MLGSEKRAFESIKFPLSVKMGYSTIVEQKRTIFGPVVVESNTGKVAFSRKSASRMRELESLRSVIEIAGAKSVDQVEPALRHATVNFNCFFATRDGHIGYRYTGLVPDRKPGYDPRFPLPADAAAQWTAMIPFEKMPHDPWDKGLFVVAATFYDRQLVVDPGLAQCLVHQLSLLERNNFIVVAVNDQGRWELGGYQCDRR